jgi:antitoxin component of RelBE/YafQ-DinJ toxin-antitoxin module
MFARMGGRRSAPRRRWRVWESPSPDAVRVLLGRVAAGKALPFDVEVPNSTTAKTLRAAGRGEGKRLASAGAVFKELGI